MEKKKKPAEISRTMRVLFACSCAALLIFLGGSAIKDFRLGKLEKQPDQTVCSLADITAVSRLNYRYNRRSRIVFVTIGSSPRTLLASMPNRVADKFGITPQTRGQAEVCYSKISPRFATRFVFDGKDVPIKGSMTGRALIETGVFAAVLACGCIVLLSGKKKHLKKE